MQWTPEAEDLSQRTIKNQLGKYSRYNNNSVQQFKLGVVTENEGLGLEVRVILVRTRRSNHREYVASWSRSILQVS